MANGDVVTNVGLDVITDRLKFAGVGGVAEPKFVAWGTGTTTPAVTDTTIETAPGEARTDGTSSQQTTDVTDDTYRVVGTITATATRAITEVGLFTASSAGSMLVHSVFDVINLTTNDSITFTLNVDFDNS